MNFLENEIKITLKKNKCKSIEKNKKKKKKAKKTRNWQVIFVNDTDDEREEKNICKNI